MQFLNYFAPLSLRILVQNQETSNDLLKEYKINFFWNTQK